MKRILIFALSLLLSTTAFAAQRPLYRIDLQAGGHMLSIDRPATRGSILLFHSYPDGALTGIPAEQVVRITSRTAAASIDQRTVTWMPAAPLQPGDVIFLGPTASDQAPATPVSTPAVAPYLPGGVYDPRNPIYGGYQSPRGATVPPGTTGDLARAVSGPPPTPETVGPNGFPVTGAGSPPMGPNGEPILAPAGTPGSTPPTIGPNGTPTMAPSGTPGSAPPTIGPNGTPVLAPPGTPGSVPPPVGPNGYPSK